MPSLEEDCAPFLVDCVHYLSPSLGMLISYHNGRVFPVTACPIDERALVHDVASSLSGSVGVMLDLRRSGLEVIHAPVSCHRTHDNTVPQRDLSCNSDRLQKARHVQKV